VLLRNGERSFQANTDYAAGPSPLSVAAGAFNNDGIPDLVTANHFGPGEATVSVLLGNGDGSFQSPVGYSAGINPYAVAVGDLNGGGRLGLARRKYRGVYLQWSGVW